MAWSPAITSTSPSSCPAPAEAAWYDGLAVTKPFYLTTPIYYVNGKPHVGHAYSTIAADVLTRHARVRGRKTRLLTGTDEHGKKIADVAQAEGLSPQAFVDRLIPSFTSAWEAIGIAND